MATRGTPSNDLLEALADSWGVDRNKVVAISVELRRDHYPKVVFEYAPPEGDVREIFRISSGGNP